MRVCVRVRVRVFCCCCSCLCVCFVINVPCFLTFNIVSLYMLRSLFITGRHSCVHCLVRRTEFTQLNYNLFYEPNLQRETNVIYCVPHVWTLLLEHLGTCTLFMHTLRNRGHLVYSLTRYKVSYLVKCNLSFKESPHS